MTKRDVDSEPKPAALFLSPEAPYPLIGGGSLRSASLLHYLARRYRVDAIVFREPGAADPAHSLPPGLVRELHTIDLPYHARHTPARAARNASRLIRRIPPLIDRFAGFAEGVSELVGRRHYALSVIEHFWCAPYWAQLSPRSDKTVLDVHNVESVLHRRCQGVESQPAAFAHSLFHKACLELERQWFPRFSCLLAASQQDAALIRAISPESRVTVYPNSIPMVPLPDREEEDAIVFSGNLEYHPNISAVRFFRKEIWTRLRDRWPGLVWRLVGKNPHAVEEFTRGDPRIQVSGPVQDAVGELAAAKVAIVPLLAGSGTRLKIIEAWASGRPVVSTHLGAEGLPVQPGRNILLADDPAGFANAVSALLESAALRKRIGSAGRTLFEQDYTWEKAWAKLAL